MQITFLGCGNSRGVPYINCHCYVCTSTNKKNKRKRPSLLIEENNNTILIDTSPDLKQQCMENNITKIDAVIYTHDHFDHVAGIDDLRSFCHGTKPINAYIDDNTFASMSRRYDYLFQGLSRQCHPMLKRNKLDAFQEINGIQCVSFNQIHGSILSRGIRIKNFAYSTDFNEIPEESVEYLNDLEIWVVDCTRYSYAETHSYYEKTLMLIERFKPKLAVLTHMSHEIEYEEISKIIPKGVIAAYDNLIINI